MKIHTIRAFLTAVFLCGISAPGTYAGPGDTTVVQTFTFGSPLEGKFLFPSETSRWGKILMYYTLKCNPAQFPACGEWDYLTYTYLYRHTGIWDSTAYSHPNFQINGSTPDSLMYMDSTSFSFRPWFEFANQTIPVSITGVGDSAARSGLFFSNPAVDGRSQSVYTAGELAQAGLQPGQITGLRYRFSEASGTLKKLRIRMKHLPVDTLNPAMPESSGFTEVFLRDWMIADTGWQTLPLTWPFEWDGVSSILVDISFAECSSFPGNINYSGIAAGTAIVCDTIKDSSLSFRDMDYVKVPAEVFSDLDSAITIAFWQYGDPLLQPQNNTIFEGIDSAGHRILNVHLPWGNGKVYWDAGWRDGDYDRVVYTPPDASRYRGQWNHWAFTKDLKNNRMKIYFNGTLVFVQVSKTRPMTGVQQFRIGSDGSGTGLYYDGLVDEFSVWNKALSDTSIRLMMYRDITQGHPDYAYLRAYYKFNEGEGFSTQDHSPGGHTATLAGYPEWKSYQGKDLFRNFSYADSRPCIQFEQGVWDPAGLDSTMKTDTLANPPIMIVLFSDSVHPYNPTDTLTRYPSWYNNFVYDPQGNAIDSTLVPPDGILYRKDYVYYGQPYEILERYELARYITPYGNNLSLGDGWTWVYDLTDYAPLLHDSVHLTAGNWQELLDMKFMMIEGIPPRDVLEVRNVYTGTHGYADASQHNLPPVTFDIGAGATQARLKMRITGHGFGGTLNCSEFCKRMNTLKVNGNPVYDHLVWRDDCGLNPLYPQGGTWLYDRAAWCPGAEVRTTDFELSHLLPGADSITIDYDLQAGYTWNGQGSWPYYAIESQLITYGQPNFKLDAALEEVLAPHDDHLYNRFNPLCGQPFIAIKNNGADTLFSVVIEYGPIGGQSLFYEWTGALAFQDTARILLPAVDWNGWTGGDKRFFFRVMEPNGGQDEYSFNDRMTTPFVIPPTYVNQLEFRFKTNHMANYLSWQVTNQDGNVIIENGPLENNTLYVDTLNLQTGCYRLIIRNSEGEGLSYWANMPPYGNGTSGAAQLKDLDGNLVKNFQGDFGREISQSFTVGMTIEIDELNPGGFLVIYPNPSDGLFTLSFSLKRSQTVSITVSDALGKAVHRGDYTVETNGKIPVDISACQPGIYIVTVVTQSGTMVRKVLRK